MNGNSGMNGQVAKPLARRLLTMVAMLSIAVTGVATAAAFYFVRESAADAQTRHLAAYVAERVKSEDRLFSDLVKVQDAAAEAMTRRLETGEGAREAARFDALFPEHGDGTRRSAPGLFDGARIGERYVYGVGAYLPGAATLTAAERTLFVSALDVVAATGEAQLRHYDNFYFFTPDARLVMFGPTRPDKLQFYRRDAPPNLDISKEEMTLLTLPRNNPDRVMKCTKLRRLISDPTGRRLSVACLTPFAFKGRFMGAFGTSLSLNSYLLRAVGDALPGGRNMIVADNGELIAAQGISRKGTVDAFALRRFEAESDLRNLVRHVRDQNRDVGTVLSPRGDRLVAYGRLVEPGWWFLMTFPSGDIIWSSLKTASWVLLFGFLGVLAQILLLYRLTNQMVVAPLRTLADAQRKPNRAAAAIEAREDEIGALARSLRGQREQNDDLLRSLEERVAERTAELERANQAKSLFLANMSHELRTPLNGVIAIGDRLAEEQDPVVRRDLAALVSSSGRLLEQVLSDILDASKIDAGEFQLTPEPFDLTLLVQGMAELHAAAAQAKALDFRWSVASEAAGTYRGDAGRISQILSNLLANAVKFTDSGEVALEVDLAESGLRFVVRDTGVGFDATVRERLFKRFVQADQSITRQYGGTGLGLSICAALTGKMGGRISADGAPGQGARFEVVLPLQRCDQVPSKAPEESVGIISLEGLRVLVAEDHPTNRKVVEIVLQPFGVDLTLVADGEAALAVLDEAPFDAVLMDMQMPVMDGLSATRAIRAREAASGAPPMLVIMLTANAMDEHIAAAHAAGADLHLAKPLHPAQLIEALAQARL